VSFADALGEISRSLNGRVDVGAIQRVRQDRTREKAAACARIDDTVRELVTALANQGIRLAVISNGFEEDVSGWWRCSLAPQFQCTMFSWAEHVAKPDPEIYLRAMRQLGANAAEAVYIGDGADDELRGAERAGLRAWRAAWYVRDPPSNGAWPELTTCEDVLSLIAAG
jgi:HAD superfamily hydrolase (TIGR01509 family)